MSFSFRTHSSQFSPYRRPPGAAPHQHPLDPVAGGAQVGSGNTVAFIPLSKIGNLILPALSTEYKSTLLMGDSRPSTTWPLSAVTPCAPHKLVPEDLVALTLSAPLLCPHTPTASLTSTPEKSLLPITVLPLSYLLVSALISLAFIFLISLSDSSGDKDQAFFLSVLPADRTTVTTRELWAFLT